jgi:hypothetical protein
MRDDEFDRPPKPVPKTIDIAHLDGWVPLDSATGWS